MKLQNFLVASSVIASVVITGCGAAKITDEQKTQIAELRRQQASLGEKIKLKQSEVSRLESEIAERERAVAKCNEEKSAVEQRLAKWPNAWPDYTPEPPVDSAAIKSAKKKK